MRYLKYKAGWTSSLTVLAHDSTGTATVRAGANEFYLYPKNGDPAATEYFIVENRQRSGVDARLPGSGVCLWHVDEAGSNDNELGTRRALRMQPDAGRRTPQHRG